MDGIVILMVTVGTPIIAVIWFLVSIISYIKCPKEELEEKKRRRIAMIVSGVVAVFLVSALIGLIILLSRALEHM